MTTCRMPTLIRTIETLVKTSAHQPRPLPVASRCSLGDPLGEHLLPSAHVLWVELTPTLLFKCRIHYFDQGQLANFFLQRAR